MIPLKKMASKYCLQNIGHPVPASMYYFTSADDVSEKDCGSFFTLLRPSDAYLRQ